MRTVLILLSLVILSATQLDAKEQPPPSFTRQKVYHWILKECAQAEGNPYGVNGRQEIPLGEGVKVSCPTYEELAHAAGCGVLQSHVTICRPDAIENFLNKDE
ncbi:MAG: hypothetical protein ACREHG_04690 [Candidatus Saccharimonadales bacterium]